MATSANRAGKVRFIEYNPLTGDTPRVVWREPGYTPEYDAVMSRPVPPTMSDSELRQLKKDIKREGAKIRGGYVATRPGERFDPERNLGWLARRRYARVSSILDIRTRLPLRNRARAWVGRQLKRGALALGRAIVRGSKALGRRVAQAAHATYEKHLSEEARAATRAEWQQKWTETRADIAAEKARWAQSRADAAAAREQRAAPAAPYDPWTDPHYRPRHVTTSTIAVDPGPPPSLSSDADVRGGGLTHVSAYVKGDGTTVQGHWRTTGQ